MKQAVKKIESTKALSPKIASASKADKISKAEEASTPNLQKPTTLNRFLESSCDCV